MRELAPQNKRQAEFVQVYRSSMRALSNLALEAPTAHAVLYVLLERINERNALVVSNTTLCKLTGKSRSTITRALADLRSRNYIETLRAGNVTVIVVNKRVAWTTDTALRGRLAIFDARVIVSEEEQANTSLGREPELVRLPPVLVPPEIATTLDDEDPTVAGQAQLGLD